MEPITAASARQLADAYHAQEREAALEQLPAVLDRVRSAAEAGGYVVVVSVSNVLPVAPVIEALRALDFGISNTEYSSDSVKLKILWNPQEQVGY